MELRDREEEKAGGNCVTRNVMICTHQIVRIITPERTGGVGHAAYMVEKNNAYRTLMIAWNTWALIGR